MKPFVTLTTLSLLALLIFGGNLLYTSKNEQITNTQSAINNQQSINKQIDDSLKRKEDINSSFRGVHIVEKQDGGLTWEAWADEGHLSLGKEIFQLKNVRLLFSQKKDLSFEVRGEEGIIDLGKKEGKLLGNVALESSRGEVFKTHSISYSLNHDRLESTEPIDILLAQGKGSIWVQGVGLSIDLKTFLIEIKNDVSVVAFSRQSPKELSPSHSLSSRANLLHMSNESQQGEKLILKSKRATVDSLSKSLQFSGEVEIKFTQFTVSGGEALVSYEEWGSISKLSVSRGVKARSEDKQIEASQLMIDFKQKNLIFSGHPQLTQKNRKMEGEKIVYNFKDNSIHVVKGRVSLEGTEVLN